MVAGLEEVDPLVAHQVDYPVFLGETSRPHSWSQELERFRLADSGEGIAQNGLVEGDEAKRHFPVGRNPVLQIVDEFRLKDGLARPTRQGQISFEAR